MNDAERIQLLHEGANAALDAYRDELANAQRYKVWAGLLGGDHEDYANAALDQLTWITQLLTGNKPLDALDTLLAASRDDIEDASHSPAYGFIYGYADHSSPISDLMVANHEDDEGD